MSHPLKIQGYDSYPWWKKALVTIAIWLTPFAKAVLIAFLCVGVLVAQSKPPAKKSLTYKVFKDHEKHWYTDWRWWTGEGIMIGAIVADSYTTANRCKGCRETNGLLGYQPSNAEIIGYSSLDAGIQTGLHVYSWYLGKADPSSFWRAMAYWSQPVAVGALIGYNAAQNAELNAQFSSSTRSVPAIRCPKTLVCGAF
jgi:hypothetical protein